MEPGRRWANEILFTVLLYITFFAAVMHCLHTSCTLWPHSHIGNCFVGHPTSGVLRCAVLNCNPIPFAVVHNFWALVMSGVMSIREGVSRRWVQYGALLLDTESIMAVY